MNREVIGIRAKGFVGGILAGHIISTIFAVIMLLVLIFVGWHIALLFMFLSFLFLAGWTGYLFVKNIKMPTSMLEYDDTGLYFEHEENEIFLPFSQISSVRAFNYYQQTHTYDFGWLIVTTTDNVTYQIGCMSDIKEVAKKVIEKSPYDIQLLE